MTNTDHYNQPDEEDGQEVPLGDTTQLVSASEINQQIATAKRYPRSIKRFFDEAGSLVSLNQGVAEHKEARKTLADLSLSGREWEGKRKELDAIGITPRIRALSGKTYVLTGTSGCCATWRRGG